MKTRNVTMTIVAVTGIMFMLGTGCGEKDKSAQMQANMLARELAQKEERWERTKSCFALCQSDDKECSQQKLQCMIAVN